MAGGSGGGVGGKQREERNAGFEGQMREEGDGWKVYKEKKR